MMRAMLAAFVIALAAPVAAQDAATASATDATPLASAVDYTRPGARDIPIRCKPGDIEYFAGKTMGDLFGAAWPETPIGARIDPPRVVQLAAPTWPRGLERDRALAVIAVLIGPDGRAIDAQEICATVPAITKPAVRAAMRSRYASARFDGVPGTTVGVVVFTFGLRDGPDAPVPRRPASARRP